jgi:hypothetical protein
MLQIFHGLAPDAVIAVGSDRNCKLHVGGKEMAKARRGRPPKAKEDRFETAPVRLERSLVMQAKYVAAREGRSVSELLTELLRPVIDRKFAEARPQVRGKAEEN